ncbi:MAG: autotransporter assembly complex protein TamA [Deltaproteobacteria bacterium]|nr:autotransporter assembly complex protein TamA [Deltaproteobacteria bacterium]
MNRRIHRGRGRPALLAGAFMTVVLLRSAAVGAPGTAYTPRIQGAPGGQVLELLKGVADTFSLKESPPASLELLRKRADGDVSRMVEVLRSEGYYGAEVTASLEKGEPETEVLFQVKTGPLYTVGSVDLEFPGDRSPFQVPGLEGVDWKPLEAGSPARAADIVETKDRLLERLKNHGYPFAKAQQPKAVVNHTRRTVRVELSLDPGPQARFGPAIVSGLDRLEEPFVRTKLAWEENGLYDASLLEKTRERLIYTGLFSTVEVNPAASLEDGRIPIRLTLQERKPRTVGVGLRYRTDEGPGIRGSWKHRNLFGEGERLSLDATASADLFGVESAFRKPDFLRPDQALLAEASAGVESPEAYTSRHLRTAAGLERRISDSLTAAGGVGFKVSRVDQLGEEEGYALVSLPLRLDWDRSDDLLDPQGGWRFGLRLTPFTEVLGEHMTFVRGYTSMTHYLRLMKDPGLILATRWAFGTIVGAERDEVPADERFYAGGGGSVRGLPYQSAGPLEGGDPLGGRSLVEVSGELRMRLTESLGLVTFIDGGRAFEDTFPGSGGSVLWGAGVGMRYFTFLGPLRLDVAVPLDRREGVDDAFQVYLSIGQAF